MSPEALLLLYRISRLYLFEWYLFWNWFQSHESNIHTHTTVVWNCIMGKQFLGCWTPISEWLPHNYTTSLHIVYIYTCTIHVYHFILPQWQTDSNSDTDDVYYPNAKTTQVRTEAKCTPVSACLFLVPAENNLGHWVTETFVLTPWPGSVSPVASHCALG